MCGIVGFVDKKTQKQKNSIIDKMMNKIVHRGPDSKGKYVDDFVELMNSVSVKIQD